MSYGPLHGVRVLEFAEGVAGPMAARLLGDAGADVVKIELPGGDRARAWGPLLPDETSVIFAALNRNKRSVLMDSLDLSEFAALVSGADVLVVDDGAVDVAEVMQGHPRLVVCVVSGWGPCGPWADLPGGELPAQLAAEAVTSLGRIGEEPVRLGNDHAGMLTASFAMQGILAALLACDEVGGQRVDVSLFGSLLQMRSTMWVALSNPDEWWGLHLDSYTKPPEYGYTCKDRRIYFSVARVPDIRQLVIDLKMEFAFADKRWEMFEVDGGGGTRRYSHVVHDMWDRGLAQWTFSDAKEIIERHGGWAFPYLNYGEFVTDDHVLGMNLFVDVEGEADLRTREVRPPWQLRETPASIRTRAPRLGEHSGEILTELGMGVERG